MLIVDSVAHIHFIPKTIEYQNDELNADLDIQCQLSIVDCLAKLLHNIDLLCSLVDRFDYFMKDSKSKRVFVKRPWKRRLPIHKNLYKTIL
jgi:hypothetical protein